MEQPILSMNHVTKRYPDFVLDDICLSVPGGCIVGLIGENGAGKTTLLHLILNLIARDDGQISIFGKDYQTAEQEIKDGLGVVLGEPSIPDTFSPNNLNAILSPIYSSWDSACFFQYLERFGLNPEKSIKEYSRGMQMKLSIAAALSHQAKLLLLDEPTSGLDPVARDEILEFLQEQVQDESHSVILSSHILSDLEKISDYIAYLHQGTLIFFEEKDRLLEDLALVSCSLDAVDQLPPDHVLGCRRHAFGAQALMRWEHVPAGLDAARPTLEEIMIIYKKGGRL